MLIQRLKKAKNADEARREVNASRAQYRIVIRSTEDPEKLKTLATRIYETSRTHPLAACLQREAEEATQKAVDIERRAEHVANELTFAGFAFFKKHGRRASARLFGMRSRYGSWTAVHVRLIEIGFGGHNFEWLRAQGKIELTSEWFVLNYANYAISRETRVALKNLVNAHSGSPACANAE